MKKRDIVIAAMFLAGMFFMAGYVNKVSSPEYCRGAVMREIVVAKRYQAILEQTMREGGERYD